jgi:hypothetical protein
MSPHNSRLYASFTQIVIVALVFGPLMSVPVQAIAPAPVDGETGPGRFVRPG